MRAIAEDEGVGIDTITDEQIQEWINVRTKSMKAEAWWKSNGEAFTMMFDAVKELDLHFNIHKRDWYYDRETQQNHRRRVLRKEAKELMVLLITKWLLLYGVGITPKILKHKSIQQVFLMII